MKIKVGFCGSGAWGITLANLLAQNGHDVLLWSIEEDVLESLKQGKGHPKFPDFVVDSSIRYTKNLKDVLDQDVIIECVTAKGFRPVLKEIKKLGGIHQPLIITSKGIEQDTGELLVEVAYEILGAENLIGYMSGPTLAKEVMLEHPTSAVAASPNHDVIDLIKTLFGCSYFRVYESSDIMGVAVGGAMKNVIAIASGMAEGMGFGHNTKALLITRGLVEMCRIAKVKGGDQNTCFGLSGIGDLIVTGVSNLSRNFQFGYLLGQGYGSEEAKEKIGMVVEGEYTVLSAWKLGEKFGLDLPITYGMYEVIYKGVDPITAFQAILEKSELEAPELLL